MTRYFNSTIGVLFLLVAIFSIWHYPLASVAFFVLGTGYLFLLYKYGHKVWLFLLPALLPVSDMTLYSGRLYFDEFDFLILITLAYLYFFSPRYCLPVNFSGKGIIINLLALSFIISTLFFFPGFGEITLNSFSSFISPYNGLRVVKGFSWAWLLWPFLNHSFQTDRENTEKYLLAGLIGGIILCSVGILWERNVFISLGNGDGLYKFVSYLLDYTSSYRITGQFSTMRVGGTAIDGYLVLIIPFSLIAFWYSASSKMHFLSLFCFLFGTYTIMVTFSRGLYAGFLVAMIILALTYIYQKSSLRNILPLLYGSLIFIFMTACVSYLYTYGGNGGSIGMIFLLGATMLSALLFKGRNWFIVLPGLFVIMLIGGYVLYDSYIEIKWADNSFAFSLGVAIILPLIIVPLTFIATPYAPTRDAAGKALSLLIMITIVWLGAIPSVFGSRMSVRFSTIEDDLLGRAQHWSDTLNFMDGRTTSKLFGMGVGSYPLYYFVNNLDKRDIVSFQYFRGQEEAYLQFGHGDFHIVQKVNAKPKTDYRVRFKARSKNTNFSGTLMLCEKHILFSERYTPNCIKSRWSGPQGEDWINFDKVINTKNIGSHGLLGWPITFMLYNTKRDALIDITDIEILTPQGDNLITNGDFRQGSDRWLMVRDFSHIEWHAKNIYVHTYFEQGIFGLLAFLALLACAIIVQLRALARGNRLAPFILSSLGGFMVVGLFGTMIDDPRIALLFFLLTFLGLANSASGPLTATTDDSE